MDYAELGRRLRRARELARLSQTEVASALGITSAALSQYESGKRRIDALTLERLGRLYGVPLSWFFGEERPLPPWEDALRRRAERLSVEGKEGIARLIQKVRDLEELYRRTERAEAPRPHPPFAPLDQGDVDEREVAEWAERARRHFGLGLAPLPDLRGFLEAQGYHVFTLPFGSGQDDLSGLYFQHPSLGPIVAVNEDRALTRRPYTMAHEFA
ncbi:MAG: helix-turn-helix domain-containing protein, partial [Thermomicrobiaceae bacterium]|nr:helix-turn-helix domain-containing protein [Thermomicrobiaceae bacterium]